MMTLLMAETRRSWKLFLRSPAEAIAVFAILALMFAGLYLGARFLAGGQDFGTRIDSIVAGYIAWMLVLGIFSGVAGEIEQEAKIGTLEQVVLSDRSFLAVTVVRVLANLSINVLITLSVLVCILLLTRSSFHITPAVLPSVGLLVLGTTGLGLMMGALALLMKKATALIGLSQFMLLFLVFFQKRDGSQQALQWLDFAPLSSAASLMRQILATGYQPTAADHLLPAVNAVVYLAIGCVLFQMALRKAKRNGTLGHY